MSRIEKLLKKARENRKNLRFNEFRRLCEYFEMEVRDQKGSHVQYKRSTPPAMTLPIQNVKGMAVPYQVKQLLDFVDENGLSEKEE